MDETRFNSMPVDVQQYLKVTVILNYFLYFIIYFCFSSQILSLLFFFYRIIIQKCPSFSSAYFNILLLENIVNSIYTIIFHVSTKTNFSFNFFLTIISEWYLYRFYAFCNTVLVLNRFTGVFCFKQHGKIWSGKSFMAIFGLVLVYPFLLSGYTLGNVHFCLSEETRQKCGEKFSSSQKLPTHVIASNLFNAGAALALGIATAFARKIKGNNWQKKHKYENYLLIQSIITSAILMFYEILVIIRSSTDGIPPPGGFDYGWNVRMYLLITGIGIMKQIFHVSSIILLFVISKSVRRSFMSFYCLNWIFECRNIRPRRATILPATISTSHPNTKSHITFPPDTHTLSRMT